VKPTLDRVVKKNRSIPKKPQQLGHGDQKAPAPLPPGRPNPINVVANWFNVPGDSPRFVEINGGFRLDNVPISMSAAIRECNRQRKEKGLRQITGSPLWQV
jgi:hypothetical protein